VAALGCVVFDLDDTLFLERDYVRSGFEAVARALEHERGPTAFFDRAWAAFESGARGRIFDEALQSCGIAPTRTLVDSLVDTYRSHRPSLGLLTDAESAIVGLGTRPGMSIAVVSDGPLPSQRAKANALGAARWSRLTVLTAELPAGHQKPSPRAFELVETATGARGASCMYVADNPTKDFGGPKELGWQTIRVRRAGSLQEALDSGDDVDVEVQDLNSFGGW
jgi:putative hydrolase of the HAD superfamily